MSFLQYLDNRCPCSKTKKEYLKKFGTALFKDGWQFFEGASNCSFEKGIVDSGKHGIAVPEYHWKGNKNSVKYFYYKKMAVKSPYTFFDELILIDRPKHMLERLQHILESLEEPQERVENATK
jgi:hypothetical protein